MLYDQLLESVLDENGISISTKNQILAEMDESIMDFIYESDLNLLDEGAVKDFVDKQLDKINGLTKLGLTKEDTTTSALEDGRAQQQSVTSSSTSSGSYSGSYSGS